jgi:sugar porter (SP) family MFS transporter
MLGRKWTIMLGGISFMVGVAMETVAGNIATLYLGRVVAGAGVGFMSCCVPLYIAETAKTSIRGRLIAVYQFMITIGIFIATCVNSLILKFYGESHGDSEWRLAFGLQFVPCALMLLSLLFLPFSPRWLAYVGRDKEALAVVAQLRGKPDTAESVLEEYEEIVTAVNEEKAIGEGTWVELFIDPAVRYRTFLAISLQFLQQWTGINIILYFGSDLYAALGFSEDMSNIGFPLINNAVNMISTLPGMWLIEVIGRKLLMVVGGLGMAVSLALVCVFGEVGDSQGTLDRLGIGAITFILVFTVFFAATWGPVVWVYQSEIFPLRHRAKGTSAGTVSNWTWVCTTTTTTAISLIIVMTDN